MEKSLKAFGVGTAVAAATAAGMYLIKQRSKSLPTTDLPTEWIEVGTVDQLFLYPLKSGAAIRCTELECTTQGPVCGDARDRVLAVVREDGSLVTGRDYPLLTQVAANINRDVLTLTTPQSPPFSLNLAALNNSHVQPLKIWKLTSEGVDCGDEAAGYLSAYLQATVRLLYFPHRQQGKDVYKPFLEMPHINQTDGGIFSDAMSFHLVNQASVRDLNSRLDEPVDGRFFRPNIIIAGDKLNPYEEDSWEYIKIGDAVFRALAPCTRCLFTTVNPDNGEKSEVFEPLKTLRKYRMLRDPVKRARFGTAPVMGSYLGVRGTGVIHTGDTISVGV